MVLERAGRGWSDDYFTALVGMRVKMPAVVESGRVLVGYLVAVREATPERFVLEFSDLEPEPNEGLGGNYPLDASTPHRYILMHESG